MAILLLYVSNGNDWEGWYVRMLIYLIVDCSAVVYI